jgi:hypothetical protein
MSPYYNVNDDKTIRDVTVDQARLEFEYYQETNPNTFRVYINDSVTPILGTMQDVTDLELRTDTKWMLTSLGNKVYMGDYITWNNKKWMCIYDKQKNTDNCYRVKIQPCNAQLKFASFKMGTNSPIIQSIPIITNVYLTELQYFTKNITLPVDMDILGVSVAYNYYTNMFDKQSRIYLYGKTWEIAGVDYTNIDFINGTNKGFLRWMVKPSKDNDVYDNLDLGICDYYKYYPKTTVEQTIQTITDTEVLIEGESRPEINTTYSYTASVFINGMNDTSKIVTWKITDLYDMDVDYAVLTDVIGNNCSVAIGNKIKKIKLKAICNQDNTIMGEIVLNVRGLL